MTFVFKHPKYYTELRKRNRVARNPMGGYSQSDQAISKEPATAGNQRSPGPGLKQQGSGSSNKQQADKAQATETQAARTTPQAVRRKHQASSHKRQDP